MPICNLKVHLGWILKYIFGQCKYINIENIFKNAPKYMRIYNINTLFEKYILTSVSTIYFSLSELWIKPSYYGLFYEFLGKVNFLCKW